MPLSLDVILFIISTSVTPGPNNVMLVASGVNHGIRKSLPHLLGINVGFLLMLIVLCFGLGSVFETAPNLHLIIKVVGVTYLLYLAWLIARTPTTTFEGGKARPLTFHQAAVFQWVNPKAWVMITGAVASFTNQAAPIAPQILTITALFAIFGPPCGTIWLLGGASLKRLLQNPLYLKRFNVTMAVLLALSVRPVILELIRYGTQ